MKVMTALKRSRTAVPVEAVLLVLAVAAFAYWKAWQLGAIAGLVLAYLVKDVLNIARIKRRLAADPTYADREKTGW